MSTFKTAKAVRQLIDIGTRYQHIRPVPKMPNFAAVIEGVDLTKPLTAPVRQELVQALLDFEVIFFPPQQITPEQHLALAEVFGPIAQGAYNPRKTGYSDIEIIENDERRPPSIDHWHSDITWVENPPAGTVIQIVEVPPVGGNTAWASMSKAYEALSPGYRAYLDGLTATHTWEVSNWRKYLADLGEDVLINAIREFKPVVHPVIKVHPESGKRVLFVNETFTKKIDGISELESKEVLRFLAQWIKTPEFIYTHAWEPHGIAVWDNRTTQHFALADYWPHRRVNQRVTFNARGIEARAGNALSVVGGEAIEPTVAFGT